MEKSPQKNQGRKKTANSRLKLKEKARLGQRKSSKEESTLVADPTRKVGPKQRKGKFAKLRGRATVRMTTEEVLALTRGN